MAVLTDIVREIVYQHFYTRYECKNMAPMVTSSPATEIINKIAFYRNLEINLEWNTTIDSYILKVKLDIDDDTEKCLYWSAHLADQIITGDVEELARYINRGLASCLKPVPKTKASRILYGL